LGCGVGILAVLGGALLNPMSRWPIGLGSIHGMLGTMAGIVAFSLRRETVGAAKPVAVAPSSLPRKEIRLAVAVASGIFLLYIGNFSTRWFHASFLHNEAMRRSELNPGLFDQSGRIRDGAEPTIRQAVAFYERSLQKRPGSPTTYYKLAHVYNQLGDPNKALQTYRTLQEYAPDYSEVHYNLAVIYYTLGEAERQAAARYVEMIRNPDQRTPDVEDPQESYEYHMVRTRNQFEKSIEAFTRAAEMSNKVSVHFFKASTINLYAQVLPPNSDEARENFRRAGDIFANASTLPLTQATQQAGQTTREMEQRHTSMRLARDAYERAGEYLLAAEQAERYFRRNPRSRTDLEKAAQLYLQAEKLDDAIRLVDGSIVLNPLNPEIQLLKLRLYVDAGRSELAGNHGRFLLALDEQMHESGQEFLSASARNEVLAQVPGTSPDAGGGS
ncbi:MAG: tetratricopeptide repeat protein, partial [Candidatus Sumerlaeia bacterium]|nr:tetratricopeptide repeat protein [Candidatus Sumerlaeia bacterium]